MSEIEQSTDVDMYFIEDLLSRMTLSQKLGQLIQLDINSDYEKWISERCLGSFLNVTSEETAMLRRINDQSDLNIPLLQAVDAIHGHCFHDGATVFPTPIAMSCSWDPGLAKEVGRVTAKEMRVTGYHWTFAPNLDLARDPRWGRVNETFGEDPYIVSEMGRAMIEGLQDNGEYSVLACPKHFAAYGESVGGRDSAESEVSERKLRSLFLPPFQTAIEAGAKTIMAGYESLDGTPCSVNTLLLKQILVDEWGFEGVVITDWDNVSRLHKEQYVVDNLYDASVMALKAGNHIMMATPRFHDDIMRAVEEGLVSEDTVDECVRRVLKVKYNLGLFDLDEGSYLSQQDEVVGCREHRELARKASEESIVLLKNNGVLPLTDPSTRIAVIGPNADHRVSQLGDWGIRFNFGKKDHEMVDDHKDTYVSVVEGMEKAYGSVSYHYGCTVNTDEGEIGEAVKIAQQADYVVAVVGDELSLNGEIKDRATLDLTGRQPELLKALKATGKPLIVVVISGKPLILDWLDEHADALLEAFNPGLEGGNAIANIISGRVNPSGKLTISFPRHVGQLPVYYNQIPGWHGNGNGTGDYIDISAEPLYHFGYGLSYTTFEYSKAELESDTVKIGEVVRLSLNVRNTGNVDGYEVIQVYVNDVYSSSTTPRKVLIGFDKIHLCAGEEKCVSFIFGKDSFSLVNNQLQRVVEPGKFEIMVGRSSRNRDLIRLDLLMLPDIE